MPSRTRALSLAGWLAVVLLLLRIAVAPATFRDLEELPSFVAALGVAAGLALLLVGVVLIAGFIAGSAWASRVSPVAAIVTVPYGACLFLVDHQSGLIIALAAVAGLVASRLERQKEGAS